jgi:hypothetical protein
MLLTACMVSEKLNIFRHVAGVRGMGEGGYVPVLFVCMCQPNWCVLPERSPGYITIRRFSVTVPVLDLDKYNHCTAQQETL